MNEGKRPGGLTALAVINFIFVALNLFSVLGMVALFAFMDMVPTDEMDETARLQFEAMQDMGGIFIVIFILTAISGLLLLLSGIGYLKQKKFLGRTLGTAYAALAIVGSIIGGFMFDTNLGGGFNIGTIIGLIYPILTLVLLNTTFKEDLIN